MENDPVGPEIPKIESEVMRSESESKAGFLPVLLSKLGLGGASGAAAGVGSGIIASKAGIVALIVAGSSVAAGITMLTSVGNESRNVSVQDSSAVFASLDAQSAAAAKKAAEEKAASVSAVGADGASGSLGFFNEANKGAVSDPTAAPKAEGEGSGTATEWSDSAAKDSGVKAPEHDTQASAASPSAATAKVSAGLSRPTMAKKQGFGGAGGGGTSATLVASANMGGTPASRTSGGSAGGRMGAMENSSRGGRAAGTKMAANLRTKNMAGEQLKAHSGAMRGNLASGNVSSQGAGTVMDGGRGGGSIGAGGGAIAGGGVGTGAAGLDTGKVSENTNLDTKEIPSATSSDDDGEDKANYQTEMYAALGGIAVWIGCMIALGFVKKKMKAVVAAAGTGVLAAPAAAELASLLTMAKLLVGVATLAAGVAVAMGASIVNKGEMMIGGLIAAVGGFMLVDGAVRLYNLMSEDPPAEGASVAKATAYTNNFGGGLMSVMKDIDIFGAGAAAPK
jgi:hypothetical protein